LALCGSALAGIVNTGFMRTIKITRNGTPLPVRPDNRKPVWIFGPIRFSNGFMIETTRSQELKGDKHAQEV
jgi:hypothetical protein